MHDRELVSSGTPLRTKMQRDGFYVGLDAGIRFAVRVLHSHGIETCQSCEGGDDHAYDHPTVDLIAGSNDAIGFAAVAHLIAHGLRVGRVSQVWNLDALGRPFETVWRIELDESRPDLADHPIMFVWGYQAQLMPWDRHARCPES